DHFGFLRYTERKTSRLTALVSDSQILLNGHPRRCSCHRVLKYSTDPLTPFMLRQGTNIITVDLNNSNIRLQNAGNDIHQRRFSRTVTSDDRNKVTLLKLKICFKQSNLLVNRPWVK